MQLAVRTWFQEFFGQCFNTITKWFKRKLLIKGSGWRRTKTIRGIPSSPSPSPPLLCFFFPNSLPPPPSPRYTPTTQVTRWMSRRISSAFPLETTTRHRFGIETPLLVYSEMNKKIGPSRLHGLLHPPCNEVYLLCLSKKVGYDAWRKIHAIPPLWVINGVGFFYFYVHVKWANVWRHC